MSNEILTTQNYGLSHKTKPYNSFEKKLFRLLNYLVLLTRKGISTKLKAFFNIFNTSE